MQAQAIQLRTTFKRHLPSLQQLEQSIYHNKYLAFGFFLVFFSVLINLIHQYIVIRTFHQDSDHYLSFIQAASLINFGEISPYTRNLALFYKAIGVFGSYTFIPTCTLIMFSSWCAAHARSLTKVVLLIALMTPLYIQTHYITKEFIVFSFYCPLIFLGNHKYSTWFKYPYIILATYYLAKFFKPYFILPLAMFFPLSYFGLKRSLILFALASPLIQIVRPDDFNYLAAARSYLCEGNGRSVMFDYGTGQNALEFCIDFMTSSLQLMLPAVFSYHYKELCLQLYLLLIFYVFHQLKPKAPYTVPEINLYYAIVITGIIFNCHYGNFTRYIGAVALLPAMSLCLTSTRNEEGDNKFI